MKRHLIVAVAVSALALTAAAHAQPAAGHPPMADMKAMHETMKKQHIEDMKTVLRLRPNQEPALAAFMASRQPAHMKMRGGAGGMHGSDKALSTPEKLDQMAKHEAAMTAERAKRRDALSKFYAALDPEQRKVFDAAQRLQRGGHGRHGGHAMKRVIMRGGPGGPMPSHDAPH